MWARLIPAQYLLVYPGDLQRASSRAFAFGAGAMLGVVLATTVL